MSRRLPILFAALAALISIGVLVRDACRSRGPAAPGADRAHSAMHHPVRKGRRP